MATPSAPAPPTTERSDRYVRVAPRPGRQDDPAPAATPPHTTPEPTPPRAARSAQRRRTNATAPVPGGLFAAATFFTARHTARATAATIRAAAAHPAELTPPAGAGALYAAGVAEQHLQLGWGLLVTALVLAGYLLMARTRGARYRRAARSRLRRLYYTAVTWAAAAWLLTAAISRPDAHWTLRLYAITTLTASLAWWSRRLPAMLRREQPEPEAAPVDEQQARNDAFAQWWQQRFTEGRGPLSGSYLTELRCDEIADRAVIQLGENDTTASALRARTTIAAARKTAAGNVVIEPPFDGREDQATLAIYRRNPLHCVIPYTQPEIDYATGRARVATFADGRGAFVRLWRPRSGTIHELVCGASDAGKSRYLDLALTLERNCLDPATGEHLIVSWVADPQRGQSLPDWQDKVDRFETSADGALEMLEDLYAEMLRRNEQLATVEWVDEHGRHRKGKHYFEPTPELPILSATIEEAPQVLANERAAWLVGRILKMARKCGIRLRLVAQIPSIAELGNSFVIRPLLSAMNVICLRTAGTLTDNVLNLPGDPAMLPAEWPDGSSTAGLCYLSGGEMRPAMARVLYVEDPFGQATAGSTAHLPYQHATGAELAAQQAAQAEAAAAAGADADLMGDEDETDDGASARIRIVRFLRDRGKPATSAIIGAELGLRPSTVSGALKRGLKRGQLTRVRHGVWSVPGTDHDGWAERDLSHAA